MNIPSNQQMIVILLGCMSIGYIIMPVFSNAQYYYMTGFSLNYIWVMTVLSQGRFR